MPTTEAQRAAETATKTCSRCHRARPLTLFYADRAKKDGHASRCIDCTKTAVEEWQAAHPAEVTTRIQEWRAAHPAAVRKHNRTHHAKLRNRVLDHYGRACACCGAIDRLTIDHIDGSGKQHRAIVGRDPGKMYRWLIRHGFPEGFQTLCDPCNNSKRNGPECRLNHA